MDVTPPPGMLKAMLAFTDALVGEAPTAIETSPAAEKRRDDRRRVMDFLHNLVRLSMRVGVGRYYEEQGWPTSEDQIRPSPIKKDPVHSDQIEIARQ